VFVAFISSAASTTPVVFQVGVIESAGRVCVPFNELATFSGVAVEPIRVLMRTLYGVPAEVDAVVSPMVRATRPDVVVAEFHRNGLSPFAIVVAAPDAVSPLNGTDVAAIVPVPLTPRVAPLPTTIAAVVFVALVIDEKAGEPPLGHV